MPLKVLQSDDRVAEVQFVCDSCGKLVRTSLIARKELESQKNAKIFCCQCKQCQSGKEKVF